MMVVSAAGSTTNQLISWLKLSQSDRLAAHQVQQSLRRYHTELIGGLLEPAAADTLIAAFIHDLERLAGLLDGGVSEAVYAEVVGHGEVWSARLMAAVLNQLGMEAAWLDARAFLRAERAAQPQVDEGLSYPLLQQLMAQHPNKRLVVTGFIFPQPKPAKPSCWAVTGLTTLPPRSARWRAPPGSLSGVTLPGCTARIRAR